MRLANTNILISQILALVMLKAEAIPINPMPTPIPEYARPLPVDYLLQGLAASSPGPIMKEPLGNQADEFGCCISCGYSYCDTLLECVRPWETECPELINPFISKPILG
tara:strand:+ start:1732 stop:2058 length:327 start_codon:yes stop_codon:yes gene_type:complete